MQNMNQAQFLPLSSMIYSMLLLSINVAIVGLFEASCAVHVHATPQMCTPIDRAALKRITFSPLSRQLWEKNPCNVASILNNSCPVTAYSFDIPSREHCEGYCLGSCQTLTGEDWSLEDEQPDEFSSVMTNSSGALIGGSCTGGVFLFCVLIYFLYKLLETVLNAKRRVAPSVIQVCPAEAATNQNKIVCSRCRDAPSSPPPSYEDCVSVQGSVAVGCDDCIAGM